MPVPYLTMADIAALYDVSLSTARKWAAADHWRRTSGSPRCYHAGDAQASCDRRHAGRTMRHLVNRYGSEGG
jgi:uncharacterized protein YjcR